jgi:nitrate reductase gamma subunit
MLYDFVENVLPYITLTIFIVGMINRFVIWFSLPTPSITLFPLSPDETVVGFLKETFFFPKMYQSDKIFWGGAYFFHLFLAFIFVGHFRVFTDFPRLWAWLGMNSADVDFMSATIGGIAGICLMLLTIALITRRLWIKRVRQISSSGDYLTLLLILAIIVTGNLLRFSAQAFDLETTRTLFRQLLALSHVGMAHHYLFITHFFLAQLLIMYIPFSKLLHFGGIFFSHIVLRRN